VRTVSRLMWGAALAFFILTAVPCAGLAQEINVGVLLPLTGNLSEFGAIEHNAFHLAAREINENGGIRGSNIRLIVQDTGGDPEMGRSALLSLVEENGVVVVGGGCSSNVTWQCGALTQKLRVPFLVNTASADKITEQGWEYVFRLNAPVTEYEDALVSFMAKAARPKTAAILYADTFMGRKRSRNFSRLCKKKLGIRVVHKEAYGTDTVDYEEILERVRGKDPDLVYMVSYLMDASMILLQARDTGLGPRMFVGGTADFTHQEMRDYIGEATDYVLSSVPWAPGVNYPGARAFCERYAEHYFCAPDYHAAQAYAAMYVIADALKRSVSLGAKDIREALAETDMMTAFGPVKFISYGKKTQQNRVSTYLCQWINGRLQIVWPREVASVRYVYPAPNLTLK
jgi:branched-chain amino acid transport system substrate-binding protein